MAFVALIPAYAYAAPGNSTTMTGTASATLIAPLTLEHVAGAAINFGTINPGNGGRVTINPWSGSGNTTGSVSFAAGSTTAPDYFYVQAESYRMISITSGSGNVISGGNTMSFTTKPMLSAGEIAAPQGTTAYFTVGGTLTISANQHGGIYNGTYPVTVTYQ